MIKTHVMLATGEPPNIKEEHIGWCDFPISPVNPEPAHPPGAQLQVAPTMLMLNGAMHYVLGWRWDVDTVERPTINAVEQPLPEATLFLVVRKVSPASGLVKAPAAALGRLEALAPSGARGN